jgi:hypothetical protein
MMSAMQIILMFIILVTSIPAGYLLAWLCRDELVNGRKYFQVIGWLCVILAWILIFFWNNLPFVGALVYIGIVACISLIKSRDKKWVKG